MVLHTVYAPEWHSRDREMRSISPEGQAGKWESRSQSTCQGSNSAEKTLLCPVVQPGGEAEPEAALKKVGFSNDPTNTSSLPKCGTELCWTPPGTHEPLSQGAHRSPKSLSQSKQSKLLTLGQAQGSLDIPEASRHRKRNLSGVEVTNQAGWVDTLVRKNMDTETYLRRGHQKGRNLVSGEKQEWCWALISKFVGPIPLQAWCSSPAYCG